MLLTEGDSHMKGTETLVVSLRAVNSILGLTKFVLGKMLLVNKYF